MSKKSKLTNEMRVLDKNKITYLVKEYDYNENDLSGITVAEKININPKSIFKTLVLRSEKNNIMVCCISVSQEVDLKRLACYAGFKRIEMLHVSELFEITRYIRGGCSPIAIKKNYPTFIEKSALHLDNIAISAGIKGKQIIINTYILIQFLNRKIYDN